MNGNLTNYDPNRNSVGRNVVVSAIKDIAVTSGFSPAANAVWEGFSGFILWIEGTASDFLGREVEKHRVRSSFSQITSALSQGTDTTSRLCFSFCMRVHHLDDTDKKYIFMSAVCSKFQVDWIETMRHLSSMEGKLTNRTIDSMFS